MIVRVENISVDEEIKTKAMMKPTLIEQMIKEMNEKIAER